MVAKLLDEAKGGLPDVHVDEVDVAERPAIAVTYRVLSTPAIAINGRLEFRGVPRADALLARIRAIAAQAADRGHRSGEPLTGP